MQKHSEESLVSRRSRVAVCRVTKYRVSQTLQVYTDLVSPSCVKAHLQKTYFLLSCRLSRNLVLEHGIPSALSEGSTSHYPSVQLLHRQRPGQNCLPPYLESTFGFRIRLLQPSLLQDIDRVFPHCGWLSFGFEIGEQPKQQRFWFFPSTRRPLVAKSN